LSRLKEGATMKLSQVLPLLAAVVGFASEAQASEAHIELRAFVPTSCSMNFSQNLQRIGDDSFVLGTVDQFCNTNYQLSLSYGSGAPAEFRFGNAIVAAGPQSTMLQSMGHPVIAINQLIASGLDQTSAQALGQSLVLQVTPLAL
jgi:hypothetical protein